MAPTQKRTLQDYWKIPFRGFVPGGLNDQKDSPSLPKITEPDDASVMGTDHDDAINEALPDAGYSAIPVVIFDDVSHIVGDVRRYFHAFQIQVGEVQTVQLLGVDTSRRRALIRNAGPGTVFLGATESIGRTGFGLFQSTNEGAFEIITTEELWGLQEVGQSSNAILHILVEFDKQK